MEPSFRFTIDLVGLAIFSLALMMSLIYLPVINARVALGLLALTFASAAWFWSLMDGVTSSDWCGMASLVSLGLAVVMLLVAVVVAVLP